MLSLQMNKPFVFSAKATLHIDDIQQFEFPRALKQRGGASGNEN